MPYICELPDMPGVSDVVVVSPVTVIGERTEMGWGESQADHKGVQVVVAPSQAMVDELLDKYSGQDTWCMFSGINAFPEVSKWFRMSLSRKVRRGIITEPPYLYAHPLWQHALRFALRDWRYVGKIDKVFLMGDEFLSYYRFWNKKWDVIPFMYCTEWKERTLKAPQTEKLRVLYVGSLSKRKNVCLLTESVKMLSVSRREQLEIAFVGEGEQRELLEDEARKKKFRAETHFYGSLPMNEIPGIMQQYDVLVLPSLHDGWGAVVNEALTLGLYVLCSSACGAKSLLKDENQGKVFMNNNPVKLMHVLSDCIDRKSEIREGVQLRIDWARNNISGKAVAEYFISNLK